MTVFDRQRLFAALTLLVMALFVASGVPGAARWRSRLRIAAIVAFLLALVAALAEIAAWRAHWGW